VAVVRHSERSEESASAYGTPSSNGTARCSDDGVERAAAQAFLLRRTALTPHRQNPTQTRKARSVVRCAIFTVDPTLTSVV